LGAPSQGGSGSSICALAPAAGIRAETALRERLAQTPSFVAFDGYDTVAVLAGLLRSVGPDRARIAGSWPRVSVEGTCGQIQFSRTPGISVWQ
jgi:hypothetical protein